MPAVRKTVFFHENLNIFFIPEIVQIDINIQPTQGEGVMAEAHHVPVPPGQI